MANKGDLHAIQANVMRALLFRQGARFSELQTDGISSDHLSFHLRQLVGSGFVEKIDDQYRLTVVGKEYANHLDTEAKRPVLERQAKLGVVLCCVREHAGVPREKSSAEKFLKNFSARESEKSTNKDTPLESIHFTEQTDFSRGVRQYLVQQRLKQPYFGYWGFVTGKVKWGETLEQTALRELQEETGLSGTFTFVGVKHKMDYSDASDHDQKGRSSDSEGRRSEQKILLEDKFFFVFRVESLRGELQETFEGGKNAWMSEQEIRALPNLFDGVFETIAMVNKDTITFIERKYTVKGF